MRAASKRRITVALSIGTLGGAVVGLALLAAATRVDPPYAPGARVHFNTVFDHPNIAATGVDVSFATN